MKFVPQRAASEETCEALVIDLSSVPFSMAGISNKGDCKALALLDPAVAFELDGRPVVGGIRSASSLGASTQDRFILADLRENLSRMPSHVVRRACCEALALSIAEALAKGSFRLGPKTTLLVIVPQFWSIAEADDIRAALMSFGFSSGHVFQELLCLVEGAVAPCLEQCSNLASAIDPIRLVVLLPEAEGARCWAFDFFRNSTLPLLRQRDYYPARWVSNSFSQMERKGAVAILIKNNDAPRSVANLNDDAFGDRILEIPTFAGRAGPLVKGAWALWRSLNGDARDGFQFRLIGAPTLGWRSGYRETIKAISSDALIDTRNFPLIVEQTFMLDRPLGLGETEFHFEAAWGTPPEGWATLAVLSLPDYVCRCNGEIRPVSVTMRVEMPEPSTGVASLKASPRTGQIFRQQHEFLIPVGIC